MVVFNRSSYSDPSEMNSK